MSHTWPNGSHLGIWVNIGHIGHIWENESQLEEWVTWQNGSHLKIMGDT